jgi:hypothetical protein
MQASYTNLQLLCAGLQASFNAGKMSAMAEGRRKAAAEALVLQFGELEQVLHEPMHDYAVMHSLLVKLVGRDMLRDRMHTTATMCNQVRGLTSGVAWSRATTCIGHSWHEMFISKPLPFCSAATDVLISHSTLIGHALTHAKYATPFLTTTQICRSCRCCGVLRRRLLQVQRPCLRTALTCSKRCSQRGHFLT